MADNAYRSRYTGDQIDNLLDSIPTKENLGLDKVDNTPDGEKEVKYAEKSGSAETDILGNLIVDTYVTKEEVGQIQPKINALNNSVYKLNEEIDQVDAKVDTLEGEVESVKEEVASPKEVYAFSNGISLVAVDDEVYGEHIFIQKKDSETGNLNEQLFIQPNGYGEPEVIATRASQDSDGNHIHEHYALKKEVAKKEKVANAIKATARGEFVRVDDVSPIEHTAKVRVSGENLSNPTDVTLTVCGENLFDVNIVSYVQGVGVNANEMIYGSIESYKRGSHYIPCRPNTTYTFSKSVGTSLRISCSPEAPARYGTITRTIATSNNIATITTGENDRFLSFFLISAAEEGVISYDQVLPTCQLEVGSIATDFKPFNGKTYTPNADGTVNIVSISPIMTLFTDTAGAIIDVEYNQDTNKAMAEIKEDMGCIETALDSIIAIQNTLTLMGGDRE